MVENKRRRIVHGSGWALACVLLACPTVVTAQVEVGEDDDLKPSWPHPASRRRMDAQCDVGLVCEPLDISVWPPMNLPNGAPRNGRQVCQPGCRIDGTFYYPEVLDGENDCQWCAPETDRFGWTHLSAGTACGSGADTECTSPDTCDGAGAAWPTTNRPPRRVATRAMRARTRTTAMGPEVVRTTVLSRRIRRAVRMPIRRARVLIRVTARGHLPDTRRGGRHGL